MELTITKKYFIINPPPDGGGGNNNCNNSSVQLGKEEIQALLAMGFIPDNIKLLHVKEKEEVSETLVDTGTTSNNTIWDSIKEIGGLLNKAKKRRW